MDKFDFETMQQLQKELQEKYKDKWARICPEEGKVKLLWMMAEAGEVADIIKKKGENKIMEDDEVRRHFIEEMCDVMMYFNDVMLCYDIKPEELIEIYLKKYNTNMKRW